jgi:hypothetical protein
VITKVLLEYDIILYPPGMGMLCILCHPVSDFSSRYVIPIFERTKLLNMAVIRVKEIQMFKNSK